MRSGRRLEIPGYQGEEVPNTFFGQEGRAEGLAIVLPGIAYTVRMPVLYYPTLYLLWKGMDVLWVEYDYVKRNVHELARPEWRRRFGEDVGAAYRAGLAQRRYPRIVLVGKSLGTMAMRDLLFWEPSDRDPLLSSARCAWLTPLLKDEGIREQISRRARRSFVVIGTADPQYDPELLASCGLREGEEAIVIPDADHSLEREGDVSASIRNVEQIVRAFQGFV